MKKILLSISLIAFTAGLFTSCEADPISEKDVFEEISDAQLAEGTIISIQEMKDKYMTAKGVYLPVRDRDEGKGLFSVDTIAPSQKKPIYIIGRVVSDDFTGNMYKTLVIQDANHPEQGIKIGIDGSNLSGLFPAGQKIAIRINDLCVGRYANEAQLCVPSYNDNIYATNANGKVGWAPGRVPLGTFVKNAFRMGQPEPKKIVIDTLTIADIQSYGYTDYKSINKICGRLVYIKGVHFIKQSYSVGYSSVTALTLVNPNTNGGENSSVFGPTTNGIGFTQSRFVEDANGNYIAVATSEYAKYARYILPGFEPAFKNQTMDSVVTYTGDIIGTVAFYVDKGKNLGGTNSQAAYSVYPRYFPTISPNGLTDFINFQRTKADGTVEPWSPTEWSLNMK